MKKILKITLTSFAVFSLISCVDNQTSNNGSSANGGLSNSESSSSVPQDVYYHVTFLNYDETLLYEVDVLEGNEAVYSGEIPKRVEQNGFLYEFECWDQDLSSIHSDVTTRATFKIVGTDGFGPINW